MNIDIHKGRQAAAIESGAFVISAPQYIERSDFPDDFPVPLPDDKVFGRGGAAIVEPRGGKIIAGPLYDEEGIVAAEIDLRRGLSAKRWFDVVGHYKRIDTVQSRSEGEERWPQTSPASDTLQ